MDARFLSDLLLRDVGGGRFELIVPLLFYSKELDHTVQTPTGYSTDLSTIPPYVPGWLIPKLGDYDYPAAIHDAGYTGVLEDAEVGRLFPVTKDQADRLFLEGMTARGVNVVRRRAMYLAVHWFGRTKTTTKRAITAPIEKVLPP